MRSSEDRVQILLHQVEQMAILRWRFTVAQKIGVGLIVVIAIGLLSMLQIYRGLEIVEEGVHKLAGVEAPLNAAAYEMEVNVNGIGLAALKYLATGDPRYKVLVEEDEDDFVNYHATYLRLVQTPGERALGQEAGHLFEPFRALAHGLMQKRDAQEALFVAVTSELEQIDRIIDDQLQTDAAEHLQSTQALVLVNVEAEASEIGFRLAAYQRRATAEARDTVFAKKEEFRDALAAVQGLDLGKREARLVARLQTLAGRIDGSIGEVLALEDRIRIERQRFLEFRVEMDQLFDFRLQPLAVQGLEGPRREAENAAIRVLANMRYLIPLYVLATCVIGLLLITLIIRPLRRLKRGAEAIGAGDLSYRITADATDEFGDLTRQFNLMVEQLEATTVSKELLEESEEKLKAMVATLRHEIDERERSEREREALQAELNRTERMSAMGSLVAGVAHEVRNPLFGISSTLDAMQARLGDREEYRRYVDILSVQVSRLSKLMGDLLDYGKPAEPEFTTEPAGIIIGRAIDSTKELAEEMGVTIDPRSTAEALRVRLGSRVVHVLQNLIENAVQHSLRGGTVEVGFKLIGDGGPDHGQWVEFSVADAGPGFTLEDLPNVFDPFFTRRPRGTGMGLAIVQRIVVEQGGRVCAANRPKGGAVVTVRLPVQPLESTNPSETVIDGKAKDPHR
jgi:signal transduction histidine kinase